MTTSAVAVCGQHRSACAKSPDSIRQRHKVGRVLRNELILTELEALYLLTKGLIAPADGTAKEGSLFKLLKSESDIRDLQVYANLKSLGFYVRKEPDGLSFRRDSRREYSRPIRIAMEDSFVSFAELNCMLPTTWATLDDQGDITYFISEPWEPVGAVDPPGQGQSMVEVGEIAFFDKNLGTWMGEEFYGLLLLNRNEREYFQGKQKTIEAAVFADLVSRRCIVKTGFKYGCNFRVYLKSLEDHAELLVSTLREREEWFKVSRAVRLAHAVRKSMVFAGEVNGKIRYVRITRISREYLKNQT